MFISNKNTYFFQKNKIIFMTTNRDGYHEGGGNAWREGGLTNDSPGTDHVI